MKTVTNGTDVFDCGDITTVQNITAASGVIGITANQNHTIAIVQWVSGSGNAVRLLASTALNVGAVAEIFALGGAITLSIGSIGFPGAFPDGDTTKTIPAGKGLRLVSLGSGTWAVAAGG